MDFFTQQDAARRRTGWLVVQFVLGVLATIIVVQALIAAVAGGKDFGRAFLMPDLFAGVATVTSAVLLLTTWIKLLQLRKGGLVVVQQLDARQLHPASVNFHEKRLLNVVEEMALASGVPVPPVFVLDKEEGINAFAAGYNPDDAVIGVTRGMLTRLNREEQQGVVAHEFSHILNGDMRLNLRLMAMIHGLLFLSTIGYWILRIGLNSDRGSRRSKDNNGLALAAVGGGLLLIGQLSAFFGRLMQSAVSRQREFLADASAVQFTRNPAGLADALKKIGGNQSGATVQAAAADEMNHLFFAAGRRRWLSLLATHPPLEERILRLEPSFNGTFPASVPVTGFVEAMNTVQTPNLVPREPALPPPLPSAPAAHEAIRIDDVLVRPARMAEAVGDPLQAHLERVREIFAALPPDVTRALQDPPGACAVVLGLLISNEAAVRDRQIETLRRIGPQGLARDVNRLERDLLAVPAPARLPMIDLALPALRQLSENQLAEFQVLIDTLMEADQDISLFEYALQHVLKRHLHAGSGRPRLAGNVIRGLAPVAGEVSVALSALARVGAARERDAAPAFEAGVKMLAAHGVSLRFLPPQESSLPILHECLDRLALTTFRLRRSILEACTRTIAYDRRIGAEEAELLRVLSDALDCPVPVWIRGGAED